MIKIVTLSDIAKKSGVHMSTVSKALNDSQDLNEETREAIKKIAKELNYVNIRKISKSNANINLNIGVICPEIRSNYYAQLISVIEKNLKQNGYSLVIGFSSFQFDNEVHYLSHFANNGVCGIIFITENDTIDEALKNFNKKFNMPLVLIATESETQEYDCIKIDDSLGVELALEHIIEMGHRNIAYIGDMFTKNRLAVFMSTLKKHNIKSNANLIKVSDKRFEECGYEKMKEMLKSGHVPAAVFAAYDDIAIGAIRAILEQGLRVPEDISIAAIDNVDVAPYLSKNLTTVSYPINEVGNIATEILVRKISDKNYKVIKHISLKPELIIRESTIKSINCPD